jgi:hypothetical protein
MNRANRVVVLRIERSEPVHISEVVKKSIDMDDCSCSELVCFRQPRYVGERLHSVYGGRCWCRPQA